MEITTMHSRSRERDRLLLCERSRRDPHYRELFWEEGRHWHQSLERLIQREESSDTQIQHQIDEARPGSATQMALEQQLLDSVDQDIAWYSQIRGQLDAEHARWRTGGRARTADLTELAEHLRQIELRIYERQVYRHQITLEMLERRRRLGSRLGRGRWAEHWEALRAAFRQQDAFYRQARRRPPDTLGARRLAWCQSLRAVQQETLQSWRAGRAGDSHALRADMARVDDLIAELNPPRQRVQIDERLIAVALVAGLLLGLAMLFGPRLIPAQPPATPLIGTTRPLPTSAAPSAGDVPDLIRRGEEQLQQGRPADALALFQSALAADPAGPRAYEALDDMAFCHYELGQIDAALDLWRRALALNPSSPDANAGRATALYGRGATDEALDLYRHAVALDARYLDESWMRAERLWSERALADSRPLRAALQ